MKFRMAVCIGLLLLAAGGGLAQTSASGQIAGVVRDPSGAVVAGAKVELTGDAGVRREAQSGSAGNFLFTLLPPGSYKVTVTAGGFKSVTFDPVPVRVTETTTLDASLTVSGSPSESVTVTGEGALAQTSAPVMGRVVDSRQLGELPLATRNFTQILGLSTGAAVALADNTAVGRNSQNISVNGARVTQNNYVINGIDANSIGTNSAPSLSIPAPESIQEFKVQTSLYDATFGRNAGGNVQAITKSGSNEFHGGAYYYLRNDKFNANNPFLKAAGIARPPLKRNIFGGMLGGALVKDKLFFFGSYQGTRERNAASVINSVSQNILIAPGLTNDRSEATLLRTFQPLIGAGQPATSINRTALALLNARLADGNFAIPTPQANGRYTGCTKSLYDENQFNANFDWRMSERGSLSVKLFFFNSPQVLALPSFVGSGSNLAGWGNKQQNNGRLASLNYIRIFTPNIVNELRAGYNFLRVDAFPQHPIKDSDIGITRGNQNQYPGLGMIRVAAAAGGFVIGTSPTIDVQAVAPSATLADTLSITRGKHSFRVGGEMRRNENNYFLGFFTRGQVDFLSFNEFLVGRPFVTIFGSGIGNRSLRALDWALFAQDDWKVSRKLTLNFGVRYEYAAPFTDTRGRIATFDPGLYQPRPLAIGGVPIGPPVGGYVQAGNVTREFDIEGIPNVSDHVLKNRDFNNWGPRFGFAYAPFASERLVFRGGYGLYYSRTSAQYITLNVIAPPTYVFGAQVFGATAVGAIANPFPAVPPASAFPTLVPGVALSGTHFDRNIRTPYLHQANFTTQWTMFKDWLVEAGWVGTRGLNLFRQVAINQAPLASPQNPIRNAVTGDVITVTTPANAGLRAPYQGVSVNGFFQNQSTAQSVYHSLQASLTKRFSRGLQMLASYTWAKSLDNASGQGAGAGFGGVVNPGAVGETSGILGNQFNNRANRGPSDFDRRHRFVLSGLYELPKPEFAQSGFAKAVFHGWQVAGIWTSMTGIPIDIVDTGAGSFYGISGGGAPLARADYAAGATNATATSNVPAGYFFNPAAFRRPVVAAGAPIPSSGGSVIAGAAGTDIGRVGRNVLYGPNQHNVDFSAFKRFKLTEKLGLEFRAEFFNFFNHVNFANPISDLNAVAGSGGSLNPLTGDVVNAGSFGRIVSTSNNPRLVQFALRLLF